MHPKPLIDISTIKKKKNLQGCQNLNLAPTSKQTSANQALKQSYRRTRVNLQTREHLENLKLRRPLDLASAVHGVTSADLLPKTSQTREPQAFLQLCHVSSVTFPVIYATRVRLRLTFFKTFAHAASAKAPGDAAPKRKGGLSPHTAGAHKVYSSEKVYSTPR